MNTDTSADSRKEEVPLLESHSKSPTPESAGNAHSSFSPLPPLRGPPRYDTPIPSGRCAFLELPEEVLEQIFMRLDLAELTRCFRLCKVVNAITTASASINLQHALMANSLRLNKRSMQALPDMIHQMPLTSAALLATLRERNTRFHNLQPKDVTSLRLAEGEGSLYEYLDGLLLRSVGDTRQRRTPDMAIYDFRVSDLWEDIESGNVESMLPEGTRTPAGTKDGPPPAATTSTITVTSDDATMVVETEVTDQWATDSELGSTGDMSVDEDEDDDDETDDDSDDEFHDFESDTDDGDVMVGLVPDVVLSAPNALGPKIVNETDINEMGIRRQERFNFIIKEMAVDPGQDLLVLVSTRPRTEGDGNRQHLAYIHLFSLSTCEPHPEAANHILQWPDPLPQSTLQLDFQICDDNLLIMLHMRSTSHKITGWNWRAGKQIMKVAPSDVRITWFSFILLSPTSFIIPTLRTSLDLNSETLGDLDIHRDLVFSNHLELYAFPEGDVPDTPYTATHVATIDLPQFSYNLEEGIPPVSVGVRTDPPPRQQCPRFPLHAPAPVSPDPTSGIVIFDLHCHEELPLRQTPHFKLFMLKTTLLRYMPAPTSPLLKQSKDSTPRFAPVIPWEKIAPHTRLLGPELDPPNWVCFVYQNRFVAVERLLHRPPGSVVRRWSHNLVLYDFDPLRVRKERLDRLNRLPSNVPRDNASVEGDVDGIELVLSETPSPPTHRLAGQNIVTGKHLPYIKITRPLRSQESIPPVPVMDGERILLVREGGRRIGHLGTVEVMNF